MAVLFFSGRLYHITMKNSDNFLEVKKIIMKNKISEAQKCKKVTVETKHKMSIASKNRQRDSKGHFIKNN